MSPAQRQALKTLVDAEQRRRYQADIDAGLFRACPGCGCWSGNVEHDGDYTDGCDTCDDRLWSRTRRRRGRLDPAYVERKRELWRTYKRSRRQAA